MTHRIQQGPAQLFALSPAASLLSRFWPTRPFKAPWLTSSLLPQAFPQQFLLSAFLSSPTPIPIFSWWLPYNHFKISLSQGSFSWFPDEVGTPLVCLLDSPEFSFIVLISTDEWLLVHLSDAWLLLDHELLEGNDSDYLLLALSPAPSKEPGPQWVCHTYFIKAHGNKSRHEISDRLGPSPKAPSLVRLMERKESQGHRATENLRVSFSSERGGEWVTDRYV